MRQLERLGGFGGKADLLNYYDHYLGDPDSLQKDLARFDAVTAESIKAVASTVLDSKHRVVLRVVPADAATDATPAHAEPAAKK